MPTGAHNRLFVFLALSCFFLQGCVEDQRTTSTGVQLATEAQLAAAEQLAQTHCGSCHLYPEPSLLDTKQWKQVLPPMRHRLGIYRDANRDSLIAEDDLRGVDTTERYPEQPLLPASEWDSIRAFYLSEAPDEMPPVRRSRPMQTGLPHFRARLPKLQFEEPMTLLTRIRPENQFLLFGHYGLERPSALAMISSAGKVLSEWSLMGAPIDVHWKEYGPLYVLIAGPGPEPTEASLGSILVINGPDDTPHSILTGLKRPVDMEVADLNGDGTKDFVICEYGHEAGFLSFYESDANGEYERRVLRAEPGATEAVIHDFDNNGTPDIGVLMAQGDEGFDIYSNNGEGEFTRERKLRFPPVYGSTDLQIADFNSDGYMDLLYVNGDNADYTPVVKPYHGVRLYLADQNGGYQEALFFPLPGAYSARPGDFDEDGDLDIAAISYFPDYRNAPDESFVYLENKGDLKFEGHILADSLPLRGRWITMDAGDLDGDGDLDMLLGSNIGFSPKGDTTRLFQRWQEEGLPFMYLENTLR